MLCEVQVQISRESGHGRQGARAGPAVFAWIELVARLGQAQAVPKRYTGGPRAFFTMLRELEGER